MMIKLFSQLPEIIFVHSIYRNLHFFFLNKKQLDKALTSQNKIDGRRPATSQKKWRSTRSPKICCLVSYPIAVPGKVFKAVNIKLTGKGSNFSKKTLKISGNQSSSLDKIKQIL